LEIYIVYWNSYALEMAWQNVIRRESERERESDRESERESESERERARERERERESERESERAREREYAVEMKSMAKCDSSGNVWISTKYLDLLRDWRQYLPEGSLVLLEGLVIRALFRALFPGGGLFFRALLRQLPPQRSATGNSICRSSFARAGLLDLEE